MIIVWYYHITILNRKQGRDLQGELGKLEGASSPLCSLQALLAGGATVGETTKNRNLTHLILLGTILDTGFFLNILDIGYFLKTYWILSEYVLDSWILSETYFQKSGWTKSHLSRPWTARPPNVIAAS